MVTSKSHISNFPSKLIFGVLAILVSVVIAISVYKGWVISYPNPKVSYFISTGVGLAGLIQTIIGLTELKKP